MNLFKPFVDYSIAAKNKMFKGMLPVVFLVSALLFSSISEARDMTGRLGIGFNNEFSNSTWARPVPALSVKYGLSKDMAFAGLIGFSTALPTAVTAGGKIFKNLFYEPNLNFYTAFAFAYVKAEQSGVEMLALLGAEYFIPGVESLGLSFETGVSAGNATGTFALKTVGFTFLHAGIHFYF